MHQRSKRTMLTAGSKTEAKCSVTLQNCWSWGIQGLETRGSGASVGYRRAMASQDHGTLQVRVVCVRYASVVVQTARE
ncbi:hypothetical protein BDU57DRAFT_516219 [Ampelomyces quisqualis]|uniref:Uncharacterized protein n=1 Tax=Ampelomyces quisqualis TaxID=50730 RepID=A0A6A5QN48_AMPQU|nr:hypothetical protein BDU57DRAFT_516219 [Ampelomyces quisqualis]